MKKVVNTKLVLLFITIMSIVEATATSVYNQKELVEAVKNAKPGDSILLDAATKWSDVNLVFDANGTANKPIVLSSSNGKKIKLTGNSFIKIGGSFLVVSNLIFTEGYSKERAVWEFKTKNAVANNCRVTNCAIENYSKPTRFDTDSWIIFWGKNNRLDHCVIGDKLNGGTILIVELNDEQSRNNHHLIDSNFFNQRSRLGSNGGETIRIGVSKYSMTSSQTIVKDNFFYRSNGEVEIISVKSCNNQILYNTFFECEGNVVLRHGQSTIVANNIFVGNNKPFTGGIRVIDSGHIVKNNLLIGLAGERFRSALAVMNAVPNSLPSRYVVVKDASISNNFFWNCKNIIFGSGKDVERTAPPQQVSFINNQIISQYNNLFVDNNATINTIVFQNNECDFKGTVVPKGFAKKASSLSTFSQTTFSSITALKLVLAKNTSIDLNQFHWVEYPVAIPITQASTTELSFTPAQSKEFIKTIKLAKGNLKINLAEGIYAIDEEIKVSCKLEVVGNGNVQLVNDTEKSLPAFFTIFEEGNLSVSGVVFEANYKLKGDVQTGITTNKDGLLHHYTLAINNCVFKNFNESSYNCIRGTKNSFADKVVIKNCLFENNAGIAISFSSEKEDKGIYGVEELILDNCVFNNHLGPAINIYRGGNDESTTGPFVTINHCVFNNVDNREQSYAVKLQGVQYARVLNTCFYNTGSGGRSIWFEEYSWDDVLVDYCNFYNAGRVQNFHGKLFGKNNFNLKPQFKNADKGNFEQLPTSPLIGKGISKSNIGINQFK